MERARSFQAKADCQPQPSQYRSPKGRWAAGPPNHSLGPAKELAKLQKRVEELESEKAKPAIQLRSLENYVDSLPEDSPNASILRNVVAEEKAKLVDKPVAVGTAKQKVVRLQTALQKQEKSIEQQSEHIESLQTKLKEEKAKAARIREDLQLAEEVHRASLQRELDDRDCVSPGNNVTDPVLAAPELLASHFKQPEVGAVLQQLKDAAKPSKEAASPAATQPETLEEQVLPAMDIDTAFEQVKEDDELWSGETGPLQPTDRRKIFGLAYEAAAKKMRVGAGRKGPYAGATAASNTQVGG